MSFVVVDRSIVDYLQFKWHVAGSSTSHYESHKFNLRLRKCIFGHLCIKLMLLQFVDNTFQVKNVVLRCFGKYNDVVNVDHCVVTFRLEYETIVR